MNKKTPRRKRPQKPRKRPPSKKRANQSPKRRKRGYGKGWVLPWLWEKLT